MGLEGNRTILVHLMIFTFTLQKASSEHGVTLRIQEMTRKYFDLLITGMGLKTMLRTCKSTFLA